jgi:hypothetical protein
MGDQGIDFWEEGEGAVGVAVCDCYQTEAVRPGIPHVCGGCKKVMVYVVRTLYTIRDYRREHPKLLEMLRREREETHWKQALASKRGHFM